MNPQATAAQDAPPLSESSASAAVGVCQPEASPDVGAGRHDHSRAEDELDEAIQDLRTMSALALDAGDEPRAIEFSRRMVAAIKSRTPEHHERLAREHLAMVEASLDEGMDFFQVEGRRARQGLLGRT